MNLSKEDLFHDGTATEAGSEGALGTAAKGDVLDFHQHGDDVMNDLFWFVHTNTAGNVKAVWKTADSVDANGDLVDAVTAVEKTVEGAAAGSYPVKNEPLPKGLKRYNQLEVQTSAASRVTAGLIAGRDEGVPYKG